MITLTDKLAIVIASESPSNSFRYDGLKLLEFADRFPKNPNSKKPTTLGPNQFGEKKYSGLEQAFNELKNRGITGGIYLNGDGNYHISPKLKEYAQGLLDWAGLLPQKELDELKRAARDFTAKFGSK